MRTINKFHSIKTRSIKIIKVFKNKSTHYIWSWILWKYHSRNWETSFLTTENKFIRITTSLLNLKMTSAGKLRQERMKMKIFKKPLRTLRCKCSIWKRSPTLTLIKMKKRPLGILPKHLNKEKEMMLMSTIKINWMTKCHDYKLWYKT